MGSLMGSKRQSGRVSRRSSGSIVSNNEALVISTCKDEYLYKNQQFLSV